jgi:hypothetical protein
VAGFTIGALPRLESTSGLNDDYDIAWALMSAAGRQAEGAPLARGDGRIFSPGSPERTFTQWVRRSFGDQVDRQVIRDLCEELYFGDAELRHIRGVAPKCLTGATGFTGERSARLL